MPLSAQNKNESHKSTKSTRVAYEIPSVNLFESRHCHQLSKLDVQACPKSSMITQLQLVEGKSDNCQVLSLTVDVEALRECIHIPYRTTHTQPCKET